MLGSCLFSKNESDDVKKNLSVHLKPFQNYIGKTFKGEFANSTPEKPIYDISQWERVLNGNAIRNDEIGQDGLALGITVGALISMPFSLWEGQLRDKSRRTHFGVRPNSPTIDTSLATP